MKVNWQHSLQRGRLERGINIHIDCIDRDYNTYIYKQMSTKSNDGNHIQTYFNFLVQDSSSSFLTVPSALWLHLHGVNLSLYWLNASIKNVLLLLLQVSRLKWQGSKCNRYTKLSLEARPSSNTGLQVHSNMSLSIGSINRSMESIVLELALENCYLGIKHALTFRASLAFSQQYSIIRFIDKEMVDK